MVPISMDRLPVLSIPKTHVTSGIFSSETVIVGVFIVGQNLEF
jgi:hypothetical protein